MPRPGGIERELRGLVRMLAVRRQAGRPPQQAASASTGSLTRRMDCASGPKLSAAGTVNGSVNIARASIRIARETINSHGLFQCNDCGGVT